MEIRFCGGFVSSVREVQIQDRQIVRSCRGVKEDYEFLGAFLQ